MKRASFEVNFWQISNYYLYISLTHRCFQFEIGLIFFIQNQCVFDICTGCFWSTKLLQLVVSMITLYFHICSLYPVFCKSCTSSSIKTSQKRIFGNEGSTQNFSMHCYSVFSANINIEICFCSTTVLSSRANLVSPTLYVPRGAKSYVPAICFSIMFDKLCNKRFFCFLNWIARILL